MQNAIHWFRQDLRIQDNPSLDAASKFNILPIYIFDNSNNFGQAKLAWLHYSLLSLNKSLQNNLSVYKGESKTIILDLCQRLNIKHVFWNRCYDPIAIKRDKEIKQLLLDQGIEVVSFNGSLLWEPWEIVKADNTPYKVFTPFYRKGCLLSKPPREPITINLKNTFHDDASLNLVDLNLLPEHDWYKSMLAHWDVSEAGAKHKLNDFLANGIQDYKNGRNIPSKHNTSKLSPYISLGLISPHTIWHLTSQLNFDANVDVFCSELGWREFSYSQLYFNPNLPTHNLQKKYDAFPWQYDEEKLQAWQNGKTGIPIVDAGMQELWTTGYMHNRVRMIAASFLVKNLLIDWRYGAAWFWDCLVDADLASNSASWQWVAGCGADAAPYFRIFNPITQAERFDPDNIYISKYANKSPNKPIVDLALSRADALQALKDMKESNND